MVTAKFKPYMHACFVFFGCIATQTEVIYHLKNGAWEQPKGHARYSLSIIFHSTQYTRDVTQLSIVLFFTSVQQKEKNKLLLKRYSHRLILSHYISYTQKLKDICSLF